MPKKQVPKQSAMEIPAAINPLGVKSVYANNMQLAISAMDARLLFNEIIAEGSLLTVERRANVVTPIPHLRAMVEVLNKQLKKLDEQAAGIEKGSVTEK